MSKKNNLVMTFFSTNVLLPPNIDSDLDVSFIKNIISNKNIKQDSTFKRIVESVKKMQLKEKEDNLFNIKYEK